MGKGEGFERDTCRLLSLWWTDGKDDDRLWRNRTRRTSKTKNAERQLGDIIATHPNSIPLIHYFNIELKIGYSITRKGKRTKNIPWDVLDIIDGRGKENIFYSFWDQVLTDSIISNRIPLLIFKRDFHTPVAAMYIKDLKTIELYQNKFQGNFITLYLEKWKKYIRLFNLNQFLNYLQPATIKLLSNLKENGQPTKNKVKRKLIRRG